MNGTERIKAVLNGQPVDKIPVSLWKHVPQEDRDIEKFTKKTIELTDENDFDFVKIQISAAYLTEAYGADIEFNDKEGADYSLTGKTPIGVMFNIKKYPVESIEDLDKIQPINVKESQVLQRDIQVSRNVTEHYKGTKPVIHTLFSALTWLHYFTRGGADTVKGFIEKDREAVHRFLKNINEVNKRLVDAYVEAGVAGFFFATSYTSSQVISDEDYREFCIEYDLDVLNYIKGKTWFNILHIHGNADLNIENYLDYPVEAFNWEDVAEGIAPERLTSAAKLRSLTDKVLIGGIDRNYDFVGTQEEVKARLEKRLENFAKQLPDGKFIFGAGCSLPIDVDTVNVNQIRSVVDEYKG